MVTQGNERLERLRDDFCCEFGTVFAAKAGGYTAEDHPGIAEPDEGTMHCMEYLHHAGLQEAYLL